MSAIAGMRILVVEDEPIIAMTLEDMLLDMGCAVIGPAHHVAAGIALARTAVIGAAILDVNIAGDRSYPIADVLTERRIPYILATGYGAEGVDPPYDRLPILPKPYRAHQVEAAIVAVTA